MAIQFVNVGAAPNDGTGDPLRIAFIKINSNFSEVVVSLSGLQSDLDAIELLIAGKADDATVLHKTGNETKTSGNLTINDDLFLPNIDPGTAGNAHVGIDNTGKLVMLPADESVGITVTNLTGATIPAGRVVFISGASAGKPTIALAIADANIPTASILGITKESIANNASGGLIIQGTISNIDTSTFILGSKVYLSPTVAGGLTITAPTVPNNVFFIGVVTNTHATLGSILIKERYTFKINRLTDTSITTPANNEVLTYETATGLWKNKTASTGITNLAYVAAPTNGTITSSTGTSAIISLADAVNAGLLSPAGFTKIINSTEWKGNWVAGTYQKNEQVLDNTYLAIANKVTSERPAPQPIGQPAYIYTAPSIGTASATSKQVIFGNRYTFNKNVILEGWRVNVIAGNAYSIYLVENPLGTAVISQILNYTAQRSGWIPLNVPKTLIKSGSTYDLVVTVAQPATSPSITTANYNYKKPTNSTAPLAGDITQAQNLTNTLRISKTDNNAIDRTALLAGLIIGDIIVGDGTRWAIQSLPADGGTYFSFTVSPATQLSSTGVKTFQFESAAVAPITYPVATNYWNINPPVGIVAQGLFTSTGSYFSIINTPNTNAYGVDIMIQEIVPSADWDIQAFNESGSGAIDSVPSTTILNINGVAQNLSADREWRVAQADTGVLTFASPGISTATLLPTTQIKVGAVTGYIVNNETNPAIPTYTFINFTGQDNIPVPVTDGLISYVMLGAGNVISFLNHIPTAEERKAKIWLGKVSHPNLSTIGAIANEPDYITSPEGFSRDLFQALGPYINENVYPIANGANMTFNIGPGNIYGDGINFVNSVAVTGRNNPNKLAVPSIPGVGFLYRTRGGQGSASPIFSINPGIYDDGTGAPVSIPGASPNTSTLQYIWLIPGQTSLVIQPGQQFYGNLDIAKANVGKETYVVFPNLPNNAILLAVLAVRRGATRLDLVTDGQFFKADKLGQIGSAGGGSGVGTGPTTLLFTSTGSTIMSTSDTDTGGYSQDGRNNVLNNSAALIINVDGNITASYAKHGAGGVTFQAGIGRTLVAVDGTLSLSGALGSTAALWTVPGTLIDYLRISNA